MNDLSVWLVHLANPETANRQAPRRRLADTEVPSLFLQAEMHGVLPIVLANMERAGSGFADDEHRKEASRSLNASIGFSLMLRQYARPVLARIKADGIRASVVKGPAFADAIYADRALRRFTDIDLLASPVAIPVLSEILTESGYQLAQSEPADDPVEWKWIHRDRGDVMIEVQTDLVHARSLRRRFSLTYDDLADGISSTLNDPASLLLIALVHGACHHFERLIHIVDIVQAARHLTGDADEARFAALVQRTGARFAAMVGLDLGWRLFGDRSCRELAQRLGKGSLAARLLIDRRVIASTMDRRRPWHAWRRALFRGLLKRHGIA